MSGRDALTELLSAYGVDSGPEEPRTAAGRALLVDWSIGVIDRLDLHTITDRIAAIEAEAASVDPSPSNRVASQPLPVGAHLGARRSQSKRHVHDDSGCGDFA